MDHSTPKDAGPWGSKNSKDQSADQERLTTKGHHLQRVYSKPSTGYMGFTYVASNPYNNMESEILLSPLSR